MAIPIRNLGSDKHVFTDQGFVDTDLRTKTNSGTLPYGLTVSVHKPFIGPEPILGAKMPWETTFNGNGNLIQEEGHYRFYYECLPYGLNSNTLAVACIESEDGENWVKPDLGIIEFKGSRHNNLVFDSTIAGRPVNTVSIFRDYIAETARKFKLSYVSPDSDGHCIFTAISDDGHHWSSSDVSALKSKFLINNIVTNLDTLQGKYVSYLLQNIRGLSTITRSESYSFDCWPCPQVVFQPPASQELGHHNTTTAYVQWPDGDSYLMFLTKRSNAIQMLTSRDGLTWDIKSELTLSNPDILKTGTILSSCTGLFRARNGDASLIVALTENISNNTTSKPGRNNLPTNYYTLTWPEDGFMSLESLDQGECLTKPFTFNGESLHVNASIKQGGYLKFELLDASGNQESEIEPIQNREFKDCDILEVDQHNHLVTWSRESDLSEWSGRPVRLGIRMRKSRLHSLNFKKEIRSVT